MGAACGRTLFAIKEWLESSSSSSQLQPSSSSDKEEESVAKQYYEGDEDDVLFTRNRKLCLWDGVHHEDQKMTNRFG